MSQSLVFPLGVTPAIQTAASVLQQAGISVTAQPGPDVTHLLLDVPSFRPEPHPNLEKSLTQLPKTVTIVGGNLDHPLISGYPRLDLLQCESYIVQNAAITAHCALKFAHTLLDATLTDTPTLILGWGRIGKCLSRLLKGLDCPVTVAARQESDRCLLQALGFSAVDFPEVDLRNFRLLFNTVPTPVLRAQELDVHPELVKVDLASAPGLAGAHIHTARGLPGKLAPISSGILIAQTIIKEAQL